MTGVQTCALPIYAGNNGYVVIKALYSECAYDVDTESSALLWVGSPQIISATVNGQSASGFNYVPGGGASLIINQLGGTTSYNWYITNGSGYLYPNGPSCQASVNGFVRVVVDVTNKCSGQGSWTFYLSSTGYGYRVSPNPGTKQDLLKVEFDYKEIGQDLLTGITLIDEKGKTVRQFGTDKERIKSYFKDAKSVEFNVSELDRGTYFLHVAYGEKVMKSQVILN